MTPSPKNITEFYNYINHLTTDEILNSEYLQQRDIIEQRRLTHNLCSDVCNEQNCNTPIQRKNIFCKKCGLIDKGNCSDNEHIDFCFNCERYLFNATGIPYLMTYKRVKENRYQK